MPPFTGPPGNACASVGFQSKALAGTVSTIASASYLTEYVMGKSVDDASQVKGEQIREELCLPPAKIHCSVMAEDALKAAISDWKKQHQPKG